MQIWQPHKSIMEKIRKISTIFCSFIVSCQLSHSMTAKSCVHACVSFVIHGGVTFAVPRDPKVNAFKMFAIRLPLISRVISSIDRFFNRKAR